MMGLPATIVLASSFEPPVSQPILELYLVCAIGESDLSRWPVAGVGGGLLGLSWRGPCKGVYCRRCDKSGVFRGSATAKFRVLEGVVRLVAVFDPRACISVFWGEGPEKPSAQAEQTRNLCFPIKERVEKERKSRTSQWDSLAHLAWYPRRWQDPLCPRAAPGRRRRLEWWPRSESVRESRRCLRR